LLGLLAQVFPNEQRGDVHVVFDSALRTLDRPDHLIQNGMHVYFASGHRDADEMIIDMIQRHSAPKSLLIVSSDHQIQTAAKRRKARFSDADRWYEMTVEAHRANPQVVASAAELQLERQLRWKELGVDGPRSESEAWRTEFQELSALSAEPRPLAVDDLPAPPANPPAAQVGDPVADPLANLELRPRLPARDLKHGPIVSIESIDAVLESPEWFSELESAFQSKTADGALQPLPPKTAPGRQAIPSDDRRPGSGTAQRDTPLVDVPATTPAGQPATAIESAADTSAPSKPAALAREPFQTHHETAPTSPGSVDPAASEVAAVTDHQLQRWNRQLEATDQAIFPPGYGEDVVFSESFEIDRRLKRKPRRS
jgi:hypothetical protein